MQSYAKLLAVAAVSAAGLMYAIQAHADYPALVYPSPIISDPPLPYGFQMASADLNGDGFPDLIVADDANTGSNQGGVWVFLASSTGQYAGGVFYATTSMPYIVGAGDLNGDGYPDLVTGSNGSNGLSVLINNGDGTFKPHVDYPLSVTVDSLTVGDATGDGKADVVIGTDSTTSPAALVIPGNGDGTLDTGAMQTLNLVHGSSNGVAITDLNADGHPDVVASDGCFSGSDQIDVFLGQTGGTFLSASSQTIPVGLCPVLTVADLNGDSAPDVVVANSDDGTLQVLLNSAGSLSDSGTTYTLPVGAFPQWPHVADVDGDGHPDILVGNEMDSVSLFYGNGDGSFSQASNVPVGYLASDVAAVPGSNGRRDLVAFSSAHSLVLVHNLGSRKFQTYSDYSTLDSSGAGGKAYGIASADFNGDGHPDLVTVNQADWSLSVLLNDGKGGFNAAKVLTTPSGAETLSVATADFNGDGKADIITPDVNGHIYVWLGNGDGTFQAALTSAIASTSGIYSLAVGDIDGDGNTDAVVSEYGLNQVQVCKGDGAGHFDCSANSPIAIASPLYATLADVNGDGKLDIIVTSATLDPTVGSATDAYVYLGDGAGGFGASPSATLPVVGQGWGVAAGDVNGDGKMDLVFGTEFNTVSVFKGNGDGTFGAEARYAVGQRQQSGPFFVALADVSGNGYPDIVTSNGLDPSIGVLVNDGSGGFSSIVPFAAGAGASQLVVLDLDGDGAPDVAVADKYSNSVGVYLHNHVPVVQGGSLTVTENQSVSGTVSASDPEQDTLTFAIATPPAHGNADMDPSSGAFTYTPAAGYSGSDSFSVTASDGLGTSAPATMSITVQASGGSGGGGGSSGGGGGGGGLLGLLGIVSLLGLALAAVSRNRRG